MDFQKSLKVAMLPAGIMIAIGVVSTLLGTFVPFLVCIVGLPVMLAQIVVNAWAGYKAVKEGGMDLMGGALTGAITGAIAGLVNAIVGFVLSLAGIGVGLATGGGQGAAIGGAVAAGIGIIGIIIAPIFGAIIGAILGAIGAFVAGMKK
ncbi:hypothetical protein HY988_03030 [Candidatus Micrarchaeota archaeon]|nr:hypothetical protein [Candidatus Micrarchaeota archaeon]